MTEPKKTEESKKPESEAPKKDEATAKATSNTTADASKPAEPAKTSDGGANIQTKHTEIKGAKVPDPEGPSEEVLAKIRADAEAGKAEAEKVKQAADAHEDLDPEKDPDYTPPETISDEELKSTIGDVAFQSDVNTTETKLAPAAPVKGSAAAAAPSIKRLKSLVYAYPKDAKDGTVVFGYGGISITIGDLRAVVSVL